MELEFLSWQFVLHSTTRRSAILRSLPPVFLFRGTRRYNFSLLLRWSPYYLTLFVALGSLCCTLSNIRQRHTVRPYECPTVLAGHGEEMDSLSDSLWSSGMSREKRTFKTPFIMLLRYRRPDDAHVLSCFQVCHGDIKSTNIAVTSWFWTYLTDFASFKPTFLPDVGWLT